MPPIPIDLSRFIPEATPTAPEVSPGFGADAKLRGGMAKADQMKAVGSILGTAADTGMDWYKQKQDKLAASEIMGGTAWLAGQADEFKRKAATMTNPEDLEALATEYQRRAGEYTSQKGPSGTPMLQTRAAQEDYANRLPMFGEHVKQAVGARRMELERNDANARAEIAADQAREIGLSNREQARQLIDGNERIRGQVTGQTEAETALRVTQQLRALDEYRVSHWTARIGEADEEAVPSAVREARRVLRESEDLPQKQVDKLRENIDTAERARLSQIRIERGQKAQAAFEEVAADVGSWAAGFELNTKTNGPSQRVPVTEMFQRLDAFGKEYPEKNVDAQRLKQAVLGQMDMVRQVTDAKTATEKAEFTARLKAQKDQSEAIRDNVRVMVYQGNMTGPQAKEFANSALGSGELQPGEYLELVSSADKWADESASPLASARRSGIKELEDALMDSKPLLARYDSKGKDVSAETLGKALRKAGDTPEAAIGLFDKLDRQSRAAVDLRRNALMWWTLNPKASVYEFREKFLKPELATYRARVAVFSREVWTEAEK